MRANALLVVAVGTAVGAIGCGGRQDRLPRDYVPVPVGRGPRYQPPAIAPGVARRAPIAGLHCTTQRARAYGVHLELYANRLVVQVPAGIGIAPPQRRRGAYVLGGSCTYQIRTTEPTGVVVVDALPGHTPTIAELFAVWGQRISATRMAAFRGRVQAFVGGRRWVGLPERIPLARHAEIVLEVDSAVPPHAAYRFPPGL